MKLITIIYFWKHELPDQQKHDEYLCGRPANLTTNCCSERTRNLRREKIIDIYSRNKSMCLLEGRVYAGWGPMLLCQAVMVGVAYLLVLLSAMTSLCTSNGVFVCRLSLTWKGFTRERITADVIITLAVGGLWSRQYESY